jgi:hypothetical protein
MYHFTLLCLPAAKAGLAQKAYLVVFLFNMLFYSLLQFITVEVGIIYSPKSFLRAAPSVKIKKNEKIAIYTLMVVAFISCQKENNELVSNANETIYVESEGASMRVNIRGNITSKVVMLVVHGGSTMLPLYSLRCTCNKCQHIIQFYHSPHRFFSLVALNFSSPQLFDS